MIYFFIIKFNPNEYGKIYEPGFHGPIFTIGDIPALDVQAAITA